MSPCCHIQLAIDNLFLLTYLLYLALLTVHGRDAAKIGYLSACAEYVLTHNMLNSTN